MAEHSPEILASKEKATTTTRSADYHTRGGQRPVNVGRCVRGQRNGVRDRHPTVNLECQLS